MQIRAVAVLKLLRIICKRVAASSKNGEGVDKYGATTVVGRRQLGQFNWDCQMPSLVSIVRCTIKSYLLSCSGMPSTTSRTFHFGSSTLAPGFGAHREFRGGSHVPALKSSYSPLVISSNCNQLQQLGATLKSARSQTSSRSENALLNPGSNC